MTDTAQEAASAFVVETFKDGEPADGAQTAEEAAAHAADAAIKGGDEAKPAADETGKETGAEGVQTAEEVPAAEGVAPADETGKEAAAAPKPKPKGDKPVKDRIGDLTANWRQAERAANSEKSRADDLQRQLDALKSGAAPLTGAAAAGNSGEVPPDPASFDYGELDPKYIAALARHETKQALAAAKAEDTTTRQAAAADAKRQETAEKQDKLLRAGMDLHDDFDEVVMQGAREEKWELSSHLGPLLLDSEFGPQITYGLAKDPVEAARVAKLSAADQAKWLGRQEVKFEAAKPSQDGTKTPPKAPQAPPPPKTPRGNSGQFQVGADSQDFAAVETAWRAGQLR